MSEAGDEAHCSICLESIPGMEFARGCACGTVHADCLLRTLVSSQHDGGGSACPTCRTGEFAESDDDLIRLAQLNHDKKIAMDSDAVDHPDVKLNCYIQYFKHRCGEATDLLAVATVKVGRALEILSDLVERVPEEVRPRLKAHIAELESGW